MIDIQAKLNAVGKYKKPSNKKAKYLGIEVEFISPLSFDQLKLMIAFMDMEKWCNLTTDSSVNNPYDNYDDGYELRILCKEVELSFVLSKIKKFFMKCGAKVNKSCGLHVHLDMRTRDYVVAGERLLSKIKEIKTLTPKYRFHTNYCNMPTIHVGYDERGYSIVEDNPCPTVEQVIGLGKYQAINISSYNHKKTIEVRTHEGTVDCQEIYNWCRYLISVVNNKTLHGVKTYVEKRTKHCA